VTALRRKINLKTHPDTFVRIGTGQGTGHQAAPGYVALVPGALVGLVALDLPDAVRGIQREKIAERQLRDSMNLSPAKVDIRPFRDPERPDVWSRVLIADKALVLTWRGAAGAGCRAVLPDYLALPATAGLWTIRHEEGQIMARLGPFDGFSIEPGPALLILTRALKETPPKAVLWLGPRRAEFDAMLAQYDLPILDTASRVKRHGLPKPEVLAHGEEACDLRQDPQRERDRMRRLVLPWRLPVALSALALGLWCAALIGETRQISAQAGEIRALTTDVTQRHFVPDGPILDIRIQVATALEALRAQVRAVRKRTSPLHLMTRAAAVIDQSQTQVDELSYTGTTGLVMHLRLPSYGAQDALSAALRASDLSVRVVGSGLGDGGGYVRVEMAIAPGSGPDLSGPDLSEEE